MTEARRDRWGRYSVLPPGASKPIGYTRATTVAKELDDQGALMPWKATATMVGALRRPGLMARWQALFAQHPDPWYASAESKKACKALVEECAEAGGSTDRSDMGTALHAIIELLLRDPSAAPILQPTMQADIDAFRRTVEAAGLVIDPAYVEAVVVLDRYSVAGTSDQLSVYVPALDRHVVADLKTGSDLKYSWNAIAIQLAIYSRADAVYVQGAADNGSQDQRLPMPELSQDVGLVIHLPAGEGRCEIHEVDLVAGWEAFEHSMWSRQWGSRKNLAKPFVMPAVSAPASTPVSVPSGPPPFDVPTIAAAGADAREGSERVGTLAPPAVATSPGPPPFDAPATAGTAAEGEPDTTPPHCLATSAASTLSVAEQRSALPTSPDEGAYLPSDDFDALQEHFEALDADKREWCVELMTHAFRRNVSFHAAQAKSVRRFDIIRGLVRLCESDSADTELLRALLALTHGIEAPLWPDVEPGHSLGALDAERAALFVQHVDALAAGRLAGAIGDDGTLRLQLAGV